VAVYTSLKPDAYTPANRQELRIGTWETRKKLGFESAALRKGTERG